MHTHTQACTCAATLRPYLAREREATTLRPQITEAIPAFNPPRTGISSAVRKEKPRLKRLEFTHLNTPVPRKEAEGVRGPCP